MMQAISLAVTLVAVETTDIVYICTYTVLGNPLSRVSGMVGTALLDFLPPPSSPKKRNSYQLYTENLQMYFLLLCCQVEDT